MNRQFKQALADAFHAPPPTCKAAFLKQYRRRELGRWELIALQIRYIRWWVWLLSLAVSGFILMTATLSVESTPWYIAALPPFLALLVITENGRTQLYQMEELKLACRMSRQSIILARMVALGLFHLMLFGLLTPLLAVWSTVGGAQASMYLLTPYLLTAALGMELTRHIRGREGLLACGTVAAAISVSGPIAVNIRPALYQSENLIWWEAALAAAMITATAEFALNVKKMGGITMELIVRDLTKQYKDKGAVDCVSLRLMEGINGLLGANGAGKTTLMRMLCGILKPTAGSISLDGVDVTSEDYRAVLGYLPQGFGYYPDFTGLDFLLYLAALKGLSRPHAKRRAGELLELVSLQDVGKRRSKPTPAV